ncbi:MAG: sensor histidine kinase, partial [Lachnospiraceae bacterium]
AFFWFVPLMILMVLMSLILGRSVVKRNERSILTSMESGSRQSAAELNHCMERSLEASYSRTVREAYAEYLSSYNHADLYTAMNRFLTQNYKFENGILLACVVFEELPERPYITSRESAVGENISVTDFKTNDLPICRAAAQNLGTAMKLVTCGGNTYLVRNLLDSDYSPYATIILGLDCKTVFGPLTNVWQENAEAVLCGQDLIYAEEIDDADQKNLSGAAGADTSAQVFIWHCRGRHYVISRQSIDGIDLTMAVRYNTSVFYGEITNTVLLVIVIGVMGVILALMLMRFLKLRVTMPVSRLEEASKKIADGQFGTHVETNVKNGEINDLAVHFNEMSDHLKLQNRKIYVEEIALRDANLAALQSQINPHFLNNTLEIINWQSRIAGDEKASLMIEALSTMLNATMNRDHRSEVALREELEYANAYRLIIESRFGERLTCREEIDQRLLDVMVPRLVIQPIMENAVEHGTGQDGTCSIRLVIRGEKNDLTIEVWNLGVPSARDWERIHQLLDVPDETGDFHSVEIGIRNVHRRVRLMYEEGSGMSFHEKDGWTISRIRIVRKEEEPDHE